MTPIELLGVMRAALTNPGTLAKKGAVQLATKQIKSQKRKQEQIQILKAKLLGKEKKRSKHVKTIFYFGNMKKRPTSPILLFYQTYH